MTGLLLAIAILIEVGGTVALRASDGFSRPLPAAVSIVAYVLAFILLSIVLQRGMAIGVAYGIWAACGVALVAIIGAVFLNEALTAVQIGGLVFVMIGVVAIELGASH